MNRHGPGEIHPDRSAASGILVLTADSSGLLGHRPHIWAPGHPHSQDDRLVRQRAGQALYFPQVKPRSTLVGPQQRRRFRERML